MKRIWSRTLASFLPFGVLLSARALQNTASSPITQVERSPGRQDSSLEGAPPFRAGRDAREPLLGALEMEGQLGVSLVVSGQEHLSESKS